VTAVDVDALDAARAAAAEWMRTHLFWGLDPSKAPEAADMLLALPEFADLLAEVRRGRELRVRIERSVEAAEVSLTHGLPIDTAEYVAGLRAALDPT
jgi:hypothetical protein